MNGIFSGEEWLFEMLQGRNERFWRMFGMNKVVFQALVQELGDLGSLGNSHYFNQVLNSLVGKFYRKWVPFAQNQVPTQIREEPKFFPYFKDAIGAIDGSHFHAQVLDALSLNSTKDKGYERSVQKNVVDRLLG
ncbi:hypothetical protein EV361DRAFT_872675 [Lentinula raphanica]|nr:hypothetical protein EV361DRAFT_872675 [Lentinula raphanica]